MSKELIKIKGNVPAEVLSEMEAEAEVSLNEMVAGVDLRPQKIKIAPGGSNNWLIGDDEKAVKNFKAIIIDNKKAFAYWHRQDLTTNPVLIDDIEEDFNEDLPLCSSFDGITGSRFVVDASADGRAVKCFGKCGECYLNQFGTAVNDSGHRGKGKACKNGRRLVVFVEGSEIPYVLTLPPTSIKPFDSYVSMLRGKRMPLWTVVTVFDLESKQDGQRKWSVFKMGGYEQIQGDFLVEVYNFRKLYKPAIYTEMTVDEFEGKTENGEPVDEDSPI